MYSMIRIIGNIIFTNRYMKEYITVINEDVYIYVENILFSCIQTETTIQIRKLIVLIIMIQKENELLHHMDLVVICNRTTWFTFQNAIDSNNI